MASLPEWAVDADDIPDGACLLRRIPPHALDGVRPDSSNFRNKEAGFGLSVTLWESDQDVEDILRWNEECGLATIVVADIRALGLLVSRVPLVGNLNHCEIFGNIGKGKRNRLRDASLWVKYPDVVPAENRAPVVQWQEHWEPRVPPDAVAALMH